MVVWCTRSVRNLQHRIGNLNYLVTAEVDLQIFKYSILVFKQTNKPPLPRMSIDSYVFFRRLPDT